MAFGDSQLANVADFKDNHSAAQPLEGADGLQLIQSKSALMLPEQAHWLAAKAMVLFHFYLSDFWTYELTKIYKDQNYLLQIHSVFPLLLTKLEKDQKFTSHIVYFSRDMFSVHQEAFLINIYSGVYRRCLFGLGQKLRPNIEAKGSTFKEFKISLKSQMGCLFAQIYDKKNKTDNLSQCVEPPQRF